MTVKIEYPCPCFEDIPANDFVLRGMDVWCPRCKRIVKENVVVRVPESMVFAVGSCEDDDLDAVRKV